MVRRFREIRIGEAKMVGGHRRSKARRKPNVSWSKLPQDGIVSPSFKVLDFRACKRISLGEEEWEHEVACGWRKQQWGGIHCQIDTMRLFGVRLDMLSSSAAISIPDIRELLCRPDAVGLSSICCPCCPKAKVCALLSFARCCLIRPSPRSQAFACSFASIST